MKDSRSLCTEPRPLHCRHVLLTAREGCNVFALPSWRTLTFLSERTVLGALAYTLRTLPARLIICGCTTVPLRQLLPLCRCSRFRDNHRVPGPCEGEHSSRSPTLGERLSRISAFSGIPQNLSPRAENKSTTTSLLLRSARQKLHSYFLLSVTTHSRPTQDLFEMGFLPSP